MAERISKSECDRFVKAAKCCAGIAGCVESDECPMWRAGDCERNFGGMVLALDALAAELELAKAGRAQAENERDELTLWLREMCEDYSLDTDDNPKSRQRAINGLIHKLRAGVKRLEAAVAATTAILGEFDGMPAYAYADSEAGTMMADIIDRAQHAAQAGGAK